MSFATAAMGVTANGGVPLFNLGLNMIIGLQNNPKLVTQIYNYAAIIPMLILAISASKLDAKFVGILIPLWAGIAMWGGWLVYPNQGTGFGIIVCMMILAIGTYMTEVQHERFGIAGPGNKMIKFFTFLIVLQACVVFVNNSQIFPSDVGPITPSNPAFSTIDLQTEMGNINNSGGLFADVVNAASIAGQMGISALFLILKVIVGVAAFSIILAQIFPWITQGGPVVFGMLVLLQFMIWIMYLVMIFSIFYRPGPDPGW